MAKNTALLLASTLTPALTTGLFTITRKVAVPAAVPAADQIQLFTVTQAARGLHFHLRQNATVGAATTLQLVRNRGGVLTNLTAATTAGAASYVNGNAIGPFDLAIGDIIEVSVAGGATVAADIEVDVILQH